MPLVTAFAAVSSHNRLIVALIRQRIIPILGYPSVVNGSLMSNDSFRLMDSRKRAVGFIVIFPSKQQLRD